MKAECDPKIPKNLDLIESLTMFVYRILWRPRLVNLEQYL